MLGAVKYGEGVRLSWKDNAIETIKVKSFYGKPLVMRYNEKKTETMETIKGEVYCFIRLPKKEIERIIRFGISINILVLICITY